MEPRDQQPSAGAGCVCVRVYNPVQKPATGAIRVIMVVRDVRVIRVIRVIRVVRVIRVIK